jgi:hypothetical protein
VAQRFGQFIRPTEYFAGCCDGLLEEKALRTKENKAPFQVSAHQFRKRILKSEE